jgi:Kae1-associated kinase Bud32
MKIIAKGAEAVLYRDKWHEEDALVKERIKKSYRIKELDEKLRKERTKRETKLLSDSRRAGVPTPKIFKEDLKGMKIVMEFLEGQKLKDLIPKLSKKEREKISEKIGTLIGKLHSKGMIHGDLTTSNMIFQNGEIYFIDFGLGFYSTSVEDRAVDLFLLRRALESTHFQYINELWNSVLKGYEKEFPKPREVLKRFEGIYKRGRYVKK